MSMKEVGQVSKKSLYWIILKKTRILLLMLKKNDVNHSFENFLLNMNGLIDKHAPFKKVSKSAEIKNQTMDYCSFS